MVSYVVSHRIGEIGIRMALGARSSQVARLVVQQALTLTSLGLVLGVGGALATTRVLGALLYEVQPGDPLVLSAVAVLLIAIALAASLALFRAYPGVRAPKSILEDSLDGVDRAQLYPALEALLTHQDSIARETAARSYQNLDDRDVVQLLPHIVRAIEEMAPSLSLIHI